MSEATIDVVEGNRLIAEFMNVPTRKIIMPFSMEEVIAYETEFDYFLLRDLCYHTSWDWQVPAWSKLALEVKTWLVGKDEYLIKQYFRWVGKYEEAVFQNKPEKGHEIIVEMLNWYNARK